MSKRRAPLTQRQKLFIAAYQANGGNATDAAKQAGYSAHTARSQGQRLLTHVDIAAEIERGCQTRLKSYEVTADRVVAELAKIAFVNMFDYMRVGPHGDPTLDFSALTRDQAAALVEVTVEDFKDGRGEGGRVVRRVKFKLADKRGALVDLGRHLGLFADRHEHRGDPSGSTSLTIEEQDRLAKERMDQFWAPVLELEAQERAAEAEQERQDQLRAGGAPYEQTDPTH
jgi:phage terminase small subunit